MVTRIDKSNRGLKHLNVEYTLEGSPVSLELNALQNAASNQVVITVRGIGHPELKAASNYTGSENKDPRLLPLARRFLGELLEDAGIRDNALAKVDLTRYPGTDSAQTVVMLPDDSFFSSNKRATRRLLSRLMQAADARLPELEAKAAEALRQPLPKEVMAEALGETQEQRIRRERSQMGRDAAMKQDLADKLATEHGLDPVKAGEIAETALAFMRENHLLKPKSGREPGGMN